MSQKLPYFFEKRLKLFYLYIRGFPPFFVFRKTFIKKMQRKRIYFLKSRTIKKNNMQKRNIKQAGGKKKFEFALSSASAEKNAVKVWKRMPRREKKSCKTAPLQSGGTKRLQNKRRCQSHRFSAVSSTALQTNKTTAPPNGLRS